MGAPVVAERLTQRARPLAGGGAGSGGLDGRGHDVRGLVGGRLGQLLERRADLGLVALGAPALERLDALPLDLGVGGEDAAVLSVGQRRVLGFGVGVLADDLLLALLDAGEPLAVGFDEPGLHVGNGLHGAALLVHHRDLGAGPLLELLDQAVHHLRPLEDVRIVEQVGLEGEYLLDAKAPLLVPGARQPECLVPGGKLDRARASVAAQRHRQGLEHDPGDVVLRLGFGQTRAS